MTQEIMWWWPLIVYIALKFHSQIFKEKKKERMYLFMWFFLIKHSKLCCWYESKFKLNILLQKDKLALMLLYSKHGKSSILIKFLKCLISNIFPCIFFISHHFGKDFIFFFSFHFKESFSYLFLTLNYIFFHISFKFYFLLH